MQTDIERPGCEVRIPSSCGGAIRGRQMGRQRLWRDEMSGVCVREVRQAQKGKEKGLAWTHEDKTRRC